MFITHKNTSDSEHATVYGFQIYRKDGRSMPKGMFTSFNAYLYKRDKFNLEKTEIEFSMQSPTGDASDHHHYTVPCASFDQAKQIVDNYQIAALAMLEEHKNKMFYS
jgi:hypothetical protein